MHNQEQELKDFYRTVFTLKNGNKVEILHKETFQETSKLKQENGIAIIRMDGFFAAPLVVEKSVEVILKEIAAIETTFEPCIITWKNTELDVRKSNCNHPPNMVCLECQP